jgi:hypothetical protein
MSYDSSRLGRNLGVREKNVCALTTGNILPRLERVGMDGEGLEATGNPRPKPEAQPRKTSAIKPTLEHGQRYRFPNG